MARRSRKAANHARTPVFDVRQVSKVYSMGEVQVHALRGVDLELFAGEFVVLLGPSGSGKSTLLNILGGLDVPGSGQVRYRDIDLHGSTEAELTEYRRNHVGFVFQFYNLIPGLTALENVELVTEIKDSDTNRFKSPAWLPRWLSRGNPKQEIRSPERTKDSNRRGTTVAAPADHIHDARDALRLVKMEDRANHFPSQLSGGEQQRVAIARGISRQPEVLFCDEPTGALDIATGRVVLEAIERVNRELGTLTVVITHNAAIGKMADRVLYMADGRIERIVKNRRRITAAELEW